MSGISLIVALDRNCAIGRGGEMPWHLPDDLKRFKSLTLGKPVLMGSKTARAIGRELPGRENLVMTRSNSAPYPGQRVVHSLEDAIAQADGAELAVIGGGEIFALALPRATRMHLTWVNTETADADAFSRFDARQWKETARIAHPADSRHEYAFDSWTTNAADRVFAVGVPRDPAHSRSIRFLSGRRLAVRFDADELRLIAVESQRGEPSAPDAAGVDRVDAVPANRPSVDQCPHTMRMSRLYWPGTSYHG